MPHGRLEPFSPLIRNSQTGHLHDHVFNADFSIFPRVPPFSSICKREAGFSYGYTTYSYYASTISVDATSSIELGTAGSAAKGALTIDSGVTAVLAGVINGNVVVNGTLGVVGLGYGPSGSSATSLAISAFGTAAPSISPSFRLA